MTKMNVSAEEGNYERRGKTSKWGFKGEEKISNQTHCSSKEFLGQWEANRLHGIKKQYLMRWWAKRKIRKEREREGGKQRKN